MLALPAQFIELLLSVRADGIHANCHLGNVGAFRLRHNGHPPVKVMWSSRYWFKRESATPKTVGVKKNVTRFLIADSTPSDEVQETGLQQTTTNVRRGRNLQEFARVTVLTRARDIRRTHQLCPDLAYVIGTKYGHCMTRFNFLKPLHECLSQRHPVLPIVAVILATMLWFWLDAEVFALLQGLLLVLMVTGRTAQSNHETPENLSLLELPFALARDVDAFARYKSMSQSLARISRALDPIYRELAMESLDDTNRRIHTLADGLLTFEGTETWRLVYERLLRSPGLYQYRSVAWIQSAAYWQDEPGRKSMAVNFELQCSGQVAIERIAIIADELWPPGDVWPAETLRQWIQEIGRAHV